MLLSNSLNKKEYDSLQISSSRPVDNILDNDQDSNGIGCIGLSRIQLSILISVVLTIILVCNLVVLPIYLADLVQVGGDPFTATVLFSSSNLFVFIVVCVIRWCYIRELPLLHPNGRYVKAALYGVFAMLHDILFIFASLPTRTRPQLLGILSPAILPNTIICRYVILRKGVRIGQLLCAAFVLFGVFVSLIPEIFSLGTEDGIDYPSVNSSDLVPTDPHNTSGLNQAYLQLDGGVVYSWVWPLVLAGATIPFAVALVILEREIQSPEVSFITFVFWAEAFKCIALVSLFWATLIPNFGLVTNLDDFLVSLGRGLYCSFSNDTSCRGCLASGISFTLLAPCGATSLILLIKYSEGAVYTTLIKSSSKPLAVIFWTLFFDAGVRGLLWRPQFNIDTMMAFVGLIIIIPATCLYAHLSHRKKD